MSRWFVLWCLLTFSSSAHSQSTAPLTQPDLDLWSPGSVKAMVYTADGGRIIGGDFTHVGGLPRRNLARLLPDGLVDPNWSADVDRSVSVLAIDAAGRIYLAGLFTQVSGQARGRLARLLPNGQVDGWVPAPLDFGSPGSVEALLVAGNQVYAAGDFNVIAGQSRQGLARFDAGSGTLDEAWSPPSSYGDTITALASDGQFLYVNAGSAAQQSLLRFSLTGDALYDPEWHPSVSGKVTAMVPDGNGALYIAGGFYWVYGTPQRYLARLSTAAGAAFDSAWLPQVEGNIQSLLLAPEQLYIGGRIHSVGGLPRANLARVRLSGSGAVDADFAPVTLGGSVRTMLGADGVVFLGGEISSVDGLPTPGLAALSATSGVPQPVSGAERDGRIFDILPLPDGGLLLGGQFHRVGSLPRMNLLRLTPQGLPDPDWRADFDGQPVPYIKSPDFPGGFDFPPGVWALARDSSGRIYVGGAFSHAGGLQRSNVARLLADGEVDAGWNPGTDGVVNAFAPDSAGSVFVAGNFRQIVGQSRGSLAKLGDGPEASVDALWQANLDPGTRVEDLELDGAGSLFVAGSGFHSVNGIECCLGLVKLAASGSGARDTLWNVRPIGSFGMFYDVQLDTQGRLYLAGSFDAINQAGNLYAGSGLARVAANGSGTVDAGWTPIAALPNYAAVSSIALGSDDRVYASFFNVPGLDVGAWSTVGSGSQIDGWQIDADASVLSVSVSADRLHVGGRFSGISGIPRRGFAAFATDGLFRSSFE